MALGTFISVIEKTSATREGEAHEDNVITHISLVNEFIIMGPGTGGGRRVKKNASY